MHGLGVAAAVALVATGCSSTAAPEDGTQKITFLTHWGPEQVTMLEDAASGVHRGNPDITVEVQAVPFGNLLSTLRTQGASPDGPTIAGIYDALAAGARP